MQSAIHVIDEVLLLTLDGATGNVFPTISDALASREDLSGMSLLLDVVRALVGDAVNDPAAAFTVLAPSSDALAAYLLGANTTLEAIKKDPSSAMALLGLHVLPGERVLSSMDRSGEELVLGTMGEREEGGGGGPWRLHRFRLARLCCVAAPPCTRHPLKRHMNSRAWARATSASEISSWAAGLWPVAASARHSKRIAEHILRLHRGTQVFSSAAA